MLCFFLTGNAASGTTNHQVDTAAKSQAGLTAARPTEKEEVEAGSDSDFVRPGRAPAPLPASRVTRGAAKGSLAARSADAQSGQMQQAGGSTGKMVKVSVPTGPVKPGKPGKTIETAEAVVESDSDSDFVRAPARALPAPRPARAVAPRAPTRAEKGKQKVCNPGLPDLRALKEFNLALFLWPSFLCLVSGCHSLVPGSWAPKVQKHCTEINMIHGFVKPVVILCISGELFVSTSNVQIKLESSDLDVSR